MKKFFGYMIMLVGIIVLTGFFLLPKQEMASVLQNKENSLSAAEDKTPATNQEAPKSEIKLSAKAVPEKPVTDILLDVPFINQMAAPRLYNGCEVTSLAMILKYKGIEVTKNELANKIKRVPLQYQNGQYGNPYTGFVGNMENGPGLGVYHGPIFTLAKEYAASRAEDLTGKPFDRVIEKLAEGTPVWVIINTAYAPLGQSHFKTWNTPEGKVDITFKMHSVALTGFDENYIYLNDPYGTKDRKVNRESFRKAWEQMGSQAVVIN